MFNKKGNRAKTTNTCLKRKYSQDTTAIGNGPELIVVQSKNTLLELWTTTGPDWASRRPILRPPSVFPSRI